MLIALSGLQILKSCSLSLAEPDLRVRCRFRKNSSLVSSKTALSSLLCPPATREAPTSSAKAAATL